MPIVADNIDTLILNVKLRQDFPLELAQQLEVLKEACEDAEEDLVTDYRTEPESPWFEAGDEWPLFLAGFSPGSEKNPQSSRTSFRPLGSHGPPHRSCTRRAGQTRQV